jgi:hypothetical protein
MQIALNAKKKSKKMQKMPKMQEKKVDNAT